MIKIDIIPPCFLFLLGVRIFVLKEFYFHSGSIHGAQAQSTAVVVCLFSLFWLWQLFLKKTAKSNRSLFLLILALLGTGGGTIALLVNFGFIKPALLLMIILPVLIAFFWTKRSADSTGE